MLDVVRGAPPTLVNSRAPSVRLSVYLLRSSLATHRPWSTVDQSSESTLEECGTELIIPMKSCVWATIPRCIEASQVV